MAAPVIATAAACGSLITAVKSSWELSRMVRNKNKQVQMPKRARGVLDELHETYRDGFMTDAEYNEWYDKFLTAIAHKDVQALRKVETHLDIISYRNLQEVQLAQIEERSASSSRSRSRSTARSLSSRRRTSRAPSRSLSVDTSACYLDARGQQLGLPSPYDDAPPAPRRRVTIASPLPSARSVRTTETRWEEFADDAVSPRTPRFDEGGFRDDRGRARGRSRSSSARGESMGSGRGRSESVSRYEASRRYMPEKYRDDEWDEWDGFNDDRRSRR